ncbi:DUF1328 domain-containing protein [soil metagenome]
MLYFALIFLVVAIIAMLLGAGGIAGMSMTIAWWLFIIFMIFAVVGFIMHMAAGRKV